MDKQIFGRLAFAGFLIVGLGTSAAEPTPPSKYDSLAEWAAGEGYGWIKAGGKIFFCRPEVRTGTHITQDVCLTPNQLAAKWQAWKMGPNHRETQSTSNFQPRK